MKNIKLFFILVFASLQLGTVSTTAITGESFETKLDSIATMLQEGNYAQAQAAYEKILENPSLTDAHKNAVWQGYQNLNMKILFSRIETPSSVIYEVQPGDSLYKIARKHSTTIDLIKLSNGLKRNVIHPGMKFKIETGTFTITVDKSENILKLFLNEKPLKQYSVATGEGNNTPVGTFTIKNKLEDPTWYYEGKIIPPDDPENILGTRWLGFDLPSYGIHGTTMPETIGKQASAGCVRMHNADVEELASIIPLETQVTITN